MTAVGPTNRNTIIWLAIVCLTIIAMVMVGGATRLTHSGLSMVDWQPIMGAIPPTSKEEWQETFEAYKKYPEFKQVNRFMGLDEFKSIFYWEYFHRLLGRAIGVLFFVPFVLFWLRGAFSALLRNKLLVAFLIGGLQGLMGWYMVMSGLVDMPRVSHYRLAAHLVIALFLLAYLFWIILDLALAREDGGKGGSRLRAYAIALLVLIAMQIVYGAFTAGLRAGYGYNTWPMMNDHWIAPEVGILQPFWINLLESHATVQFIHRTLAALLVVAVAGLWAWTMVSDVRRRQRLAAHLLFAVTAVQFLLGVLTLIYVVPVTLAVLHQGVASLVLLAGVMVVHELTSRRGPAPE